MFLSCVFINFIFVFLTYRQDCNSGMQKWTHFRTDMEHNICRQVNNSDVSLGYQFCKNITFILYIIYNVRYTSTIYWLIVVYRQVSSISAINMTNWLLILNIIGECNVKHAITLPIKAMTLALKLSTYIIAISTDIAISELHTIDNVRLDYLHFFCI